MQNIVFMYSLSWLKLLFLNEWSLFFYDYAKVLILKQFWFCPLEDIWWYLDTFVVATPGRCSYKHLGGRNQCYAKCTGTAPKTRVQNFNATKIRKYCCKDMYYYIVHQGLQNTGTMLPNDS